MEGNLADDWYTLRVDMEEFDFLKEKCPPLIVRAGADGLEVGWATQAERDTARAYLRGQ